MRAEGMTAGDRKLAIRRMFLRDPTWRITVKHGSERSFCHNISPGQDYYHRIADGEIYVFHGDERLCLTCAERRGLLTFEARGLRDPSECPARRSHWDEEDTFGVEE